MSDAERLPLRVAVVAFGQVFYEDEHDPKSWAELVRVAARARPPHLRTHLERDCYLPLTGEM